MGEHPMGREVGPQLINYSGKQRREKKASFLLKKRTFEGQQATAS